MTLPDYTYYTFSQLATKWSCGNEYLHHLIATEKIVPAVKLINQRPDNIFYGGAWVGDIEGIAGHVDCGEVYAGSHHDELNRDENWPICTSIVYFHCPKAHPTDRCPNNYVFEFFSECPSSGMTEKWFSSDAECINSHVDGEQRFLFTLDEVMRVESLKSSDKPLSFLNEEGDCDSENVENDASTNNLVGNRRISPGISKADVINAFAGLVTISLKNALEDKPRWIQDANISKGTRGGKFPSLWNPVILAIALEEVYFVPKRKLTAAFVNNVSLKEWRQEWTDYVDQYPN